MKDSTKETLSTIVDVAWDVIKLAATLGVTIAREEIEHSDEQDHHNASKVDHERKEYEKFLRSLTPNERRIYEKVENLESENRNLRMTISSMSSTNDDLRDQISKLESKIIE